MIKIDKNIPIPKRENYQSITSRRLSIKIAIRALPDQTGYRVWRIT
jgi:hypothetical protein